MSNFTTTTGDFFHNIENAFLVDHNYNITTSKKAFQFITTLKLTKITTTTKVVDHYYENRNVKKKEKNIEKISFV